MLALTTSGEDVLLPLRVQPRASANRVMGLHGTSLKIAVTAPPIDGEANAAVLRFVARDLLHVSPSRVTLERGETGRDKLVRVAGMTADEVRAACEISGRR